MELLFIERMNSFNQKSIILLLFSLILNFHITFAENLPNEQNISPKMLISYLKAPWINLNSSWQHAVAPACRDDIVTLFESAEAGEMWALKMLDATSKVPAGILTGNIWDLGMFDECVQVKSRDNSANIQGQHCMVSLALPTKFFGDVSQILHLQKISVYNPSAGVDLSLTASVCLPSSCDESDINGFINASIASTPELSKFEVGIAKVKCADSGRYTELTLGSILAMSFFVIIAIILLSCTACDFILRLRSGKESMALNTAAQFSLYTNVLKLWSTAVPSQVMPAINGLRFMTTCFIVMGHRVANLLIVNTVNTSEVLEGERKLLYSIFFALPFVVDTFFVISGFFVAISYLQLFRSGKKINIFAIYFHRYLRLTPCIAVLLLFTIFIVPHLGSGPNWESVYEVSVTFCQKNWWLNLLYVQNIVNPEEMCLLHTWYLAVEMQLFWLSPIVLYPLFYRPKLGLVILSLLLVASFSAPGIQLWLNNWAFFWDYNRRASTLYSEFVRSYPMTYNRALPYLLGILLGYDTFCNKRQIPKFQVALNWILTILFGLFCILIARYNQPNGIVYNVVWEVASVTVGRLGWSLAVAWVIYACTQGYGGPITKFLSLPIFTPLAKLCYSIYLVHFVLQVMISATERTARFRSPLNVFYELCGDLLVSIVIAAVLYLCIEYPANKLEKLLRSGRPSPTNACGPTEKQTALSAAIKKYLDSIEGKTNSVSAIETITLRLDFWQTVSDELNRLSKGPLRTPTEWLKIWQDWRSELLNLDSRSTIQSKDIGNGGLQSQAGVTVLEKEILLFLAAINCSLIDDTSHRASGIMKSKCHLDYCNQQYADSVRLSILDSDIVDHAKSKLTDSFSANEECANSKL